MASNPDLNKKEFQKDSKDIPNEKRFYIVTFYEPNIGSDIEEGPIDSQRRFIER